MSKKDYSVKNVVPAKQVEKSKEKGENIFLYQIKRLLLPYN